MSGRPLDDDPVSAAETATKSGDSPAGSDGGPPPESPVGRLVWIMRRLRDRQGGCPWDIKQNHESLKPYLLEEACEVLDAIDGGSDAELCSELGDLLLQIVFHCTIAAERGAFGLDDVAEGISDKLLRRHPHVFGDVEVASAEEVMQNWEAIKLGTEKKRNLLDGVPRSLPSLLAAYRIQEKVSSIGFDWKTPAEVVPKIHEEVDEFIEAFRDADFRKCEEEFGDLLFSLVNLARLAGLNAEFSLRRSNDKFRHRFCELERLVRNDGKTLGELGLDELDMYWERVKSMNPDDEP